ncbi:hypothetical protein [Catellatospora citrea]|uniref:Phage shock protein B n=1 Tax=Catellatospora citrea TaxID=53366 RepID=A0A8J3P3F8_9ACTN|nr:hypothetical protein [Catellatospora citrea]RKE11540.1 phage shock protein B [Catellatospora citrea]GIG00041.1 hypothetical protein Cci01nite_51340 [Catellatospora citrea]
MGNSSWAMSMGTIWIVGMLVISITGLLLWHRRQDQKAKAAQSPAADQLTAIAAQLTDLQARVGKIEKVLASVD